MGGKITNTRISSFGLGPRADNFPKPPMNPLVLLNSPPKKITALDKTRFECVNSYISTKHSLFYFGGKSQMYSGSLYFFILQNQIFHQNYMI